MVRVAGPLKAIVGWALQQEAAGHDPRAVFAAVVAGPFLSALIRAHPHSPLTYYSYFAWCDWVAAPTRPFAAGVPDWTGEVFDATLELSSPFDDADPLAQGDWLAELYRLLVESRRPRGEAREWAQVFTPRRIADEMVRTLDGLVLPPIDEPLRILDPCAGLGVFAAAVIAHRLGPADPDHRPALYADLCLSHLAAVERDPLLAAVYETRLRAGWFALKLHQARESNEEFTVRPPEHWSPRILVGDFLEPFTAPRGWPSAFDVVIANPPYAFGESMPTEERTRLRRDFACAAGQFDRAWCFFEAGLAHLKPQGVLAYIAPDALLGRPDAGVLRAHLHSHATVERIDHVGAVFPHHAVSSAIVTLRKRLRPLATLPDGVADDAFAPASTPRLGGSLGHLPATLGEYVRISRGEELGKADCRPLASDPGLIPILRGEDVSALARLSPAVGIPGPLSKDPSRYAADKLVVVKTGAVPIAAVDYTGHAVLQSLYMLHVHWEFEGVIPLTLLGWILNSPPIADYFRTHITATKKVFPQINQSHLRDLPLPAPGPLILLNDQLAIHAPRFCLSGAWDPSEGDPYSEVLLQHLDQALGLAR